MEYFFVFSLGVAQVLHVAVQLFEDSNLNELFKALVLVRLGLQLNVGFFCDHEVVLREFTLVSVKLLFKQGHLTFGVLVPEVTQLVLVFLLQLGGLEVEVLLLGLDDHSKLRFLGLCLLDETL